MSAILFNIMADMLAIMIDRAKQDSQIDGVVPHLVDGGLLICNTLMIQFILWNMTWTRLET
jgi:hypothetical protein